MNEKRIFLIVLIFSAFTIGCSQPGKIAHPTPTLTPQIPTPAQTPQVLKTPTKEIDRLVFKAKVEVIPSGPPHIVSSKTVLDFGKLPHNMVERKEVLIKNNRDFAVIAIPSANGSIARWITFDKERIIIEAKGKNRSVVSLKIPNGVKPGNYSGYVVYTFLKS